MGYRSVVAIMVYGPKDKCELVNNLLLSSGVDQELKDLYERQRQEHTEGNGTHFIFWNFDNIKWYDDCDSVRLKIFELVDSICEAEDEKESPAHPLGNQRLAAEYARIGEEDNDMEDEGTEYHDWQLSFQRSIDYPQFFEWKC